MVSRPSTLLLRRISNEAAQIGADSNSSEKRMTPEMAESLRETEATMYTDAPRPPRQYSGRAYRLRAPMSTRFCTQAIIP